MSLTQAAFGHEARRSTQSIQYQTLAEYLARFTYQREQELCSLPKYVHEELETFLRCGLHHYGFLRIRCPNDSCGFEHAVPFGYKTKGICSSSFAKLGAEVEEHLMDNLQPRAPYRQYVVTFSHSLHCRLAWDGELLTAIHKTGIDRIYRSIRDRLKFKRKDLQMAAKKPGALI